MTTRKLTDKNIRKIIKNGNSLAITLPVEMIRDLGWREKQKLKVSRVKGVILIKDWRK